MTLYSYVVARDFGFAPNPFHGMCTLATCKPNIRKTAEIGDWIIGTGAKKRNKQGHLIFVMQVSQIIPFNDYWEKEEYRQKKSNLKSSKKFAYGDNIYHNEPKRGWVQEDSHHSFVGGLPNHHNINKDTGVDRVLVGDEFIYWGANAPPIPSQFRNYDGKDICTDRPSHKNKFSDALVHDFLEWALSFEERGFSGTPIEWGYGG